MNEAQFMISTDYPVVAVISHKPYRVPVGSIYLPLHVGAALHPEVLKDWVQDNTGENISEKILNIQNLLVYIGYGKM